MEKILIGKVVTTDSIIGDNNEDSFGVVVFKNTKITYVGTVAEAIAAGYKISKAELAQVKERYILPGLVDVHSHGGGGASIPNATTTQMAMQAIMEHRRAGTTSYVGSLVTASREVLQERTEMLTELCEAGELAGIHVEGPFVSHAKCGAQDPQFIIDGDTALTAKLCKIAKGHIKWMTLAPEVSGSFATEGESVAKTLIDHGALPSWGHTSSTLTEMKAALEWSMTYIEQSHLRGARPLITHLFNGMPPLHHRSPGPILPCLNAAIGGNALAELVGDGIHIDGKMINELYLMMGRENIALITDAMEAAGMPDGEYELGSQKVIVKDRVARLAEGNAIAGGTARLIDVLRVSVANGIPLVDAVYMAATTGAKALRDDSIGAIAVGKQADLLLVQGAKELAVEAVYYRGKLVL